MHDTCAHVHVHVHVQVVLSLFVWNTFGIREAPRTRRVRESGSDGALPLGRLSTTVPAAGRAAARRRPTGLGPIVR